MATLLRPFSSFRSVFDPIDEVARVVAERRWLMPMLALMLAVSFSGGAFAMRWDAFPQVIGELTESGELQRASEREILDQVQTRERLKLVGGVAKGVFVMPLILVAISLFMKFVAWLWGRSAKWSSCLAATAIGFLPIALYHLILALALLRQVGVKPDDVAALVPTNLTALAEEGRVVLTRALSMIDFFNLWSATMLGLGFAQAASMPRGRAVVLWVGIYLLFAAALFIGLPGIAGGGQ
jgi:hypothetical protein